MDNNEIRRKILQILYKHEEQNPRRYMPNGILREQIGIEENKLDFNVQYLKRGKYIELNEHLQGYHARIANRGIDLVENKEEFNALFPLINITNINNSKGVAVNFNGIEINVDESINIKDSFNKIYEEIKDCDNADEIKERIMAIEDELKKDNFSTSKIKNTTDWLRKNASGTIFPLLQIFIALYGLYIPK